MIASLLIAAGTPAAKVGQHAAAAPSMFGAVLALLAVLALIVGLGWLLKRMPGSGFRPAEGLRVVASLNVGAKERVVVVEVNGEQLLLGVTTGGINTLHHLPEALPTPVPARLPDFKNLPNFAQLLQQRLRKEP
ncbi:MULTISPECIES: flagellar biosynthetic protein FliO [unclassified Stenotrophomonas]|uniref:flagellar biosynthetic protein FliO n=1 Tax=unclassified Stenotrophomonas TaxID=196198 RepID=UPI0021194F37|nr:MULTISPECIES: flagellar biosynthetic protein FliO [unclassified Stenotrophomonas]